MKVVENDKAKILWDFQIQTIKLVMANQPDVVVVDKHPKKTVVINVSIPNDSHMQNKQHKKFDSAMAETRTGEHVEC